MFDSRLKALISITLTVLALIMCTSCADTQKTAPAATMNGEVVIITPAVNPGATDGPATVPPAEIATEAPTDVPTSVPTDEQTQVPTEVPTKVPTEVPTKVPTEAPTKAPTPTPYQGDVQYPVADDGLPYRKYYFEVSLKAQIVYVYNQNDDNTKGELVRTMICSTGKPGHETEIRKWVLFDNETAEKAVKNTNGFLAQYDFEWLNAGCGRYMTRLWRVNEKEDGTEEYTSSGILFHSVPYYSKNVNDLETEEWNKLGTPASLGCIRLCVADVKWIYTHAAPYSYVYTVEGKEDPELWAELKLPDLDLSVHSDPTDR